MPTGDKRVAGAEFKSLNSNEYFDYTVDPLRDKAHGNFKRLFPKSGIFSDTGFTGTMTATVADKINVAACHGTDGLGHDITYDGSAAIPVPNVLAVTYSVGLKYADVVSGITGLIGWETGLPEHRFLEEQVGEKDAPDSITVVGNELRVILDDVFGETSVDQSGRTIRVWLTTPISDLEGEIYEDAISQYSGGINFVLVTRSLGQRIPSTTASDYRAWIDGVSVFKKSTKDLSDRTTNPGYIFLGEYLGTGPGSAPTILDEVQPYYYASNVTATEFPDITTEDNGRLTITALTGGVRIASGDNILIGETEYAIGLTDLDGLTAGDYFIRGEVDSTGQLVITTTTGTRATDAAGAGGGDSTRTNALLGGFTIASGSPVPSATSIVTYANKKRLWMDVDFRPNTQLSAASGSSVGNSTVTHLVAVYWSRTPVMTIVHSEVGSLKPGNDLSPPIIGAKSSITGDTVQIVTTVNGATVNAPQRHWLDIHLEA